MSLFFLINFPARQAVSWPGETIISLLPATILIFSFFLLLEKFKKNLNFKKNVLLFLIFLAGLFFKEDAVILVPLVPLYIFLFWTKKDIDRARKNLVNLLSAVAIFIVARLLLYFNNLTSPTGFRIDQQGSTKAIILYNFITVPFKMVVQNLIEYLQIHNLSFFFAKLGFPSLESNGYVVLTTIYQNVILLISMVISVIATFAFAVSKKTDRKLFVFGLSWIIIYSFVISLQTRRIIELESRYLFIGSIGVLILIYCIFSSFLSRWKTHQNIILFLIGVMTVGYFTYFYFGNRYAMDDYYRTSKIREDLISQIKTFWPSIPNDTTFYFECKDKLNCADRILPFQSPAGQILMIEYSSGREAGYAPFLQSNFLFDWEAQGYKKIGKYGFGYFMDRSTISKAVEKGNLNPKSIIAFSYDRNSNRLIEISKKIQVDLNRLSPAKLSDGTK